MAFASGNSYADVCTGHASMVSPILHNVKDIFQKTLVPYSGLPRAVPPIHIPPPDVDGDTLYGTALPTVKTPPRPKTVSSISTPQRTAAISEGAVCRVISLQCGRGPHRGCSLRFRARGFRARARRKGILIQHRLRTGHPVR